MNYLVCRAQVDVFKFCLAKAKKQKTKRKQQENIQFTIKENGNFTFKTLISFCLNNDLNDSSIIKTTID